MRKWGVVPMLSRFGLKRLQNRAHGCHQIRIFPPRLMNRKSFLYASLGSIAIDWEGESDKLLFGLSMCPKPFSAGPWIKGVDHKLNHDLPIRLWKYRTQKFFPPRKCWSFVTSSKNVVFAMSMVHFASFVRVRHPLTGYQSRGTPDITPGGTSSLKGCTYFWSIACVRIF
jgi:hypothetical protein